MTRKPPRSPCSTVALKLMIAPRKNGTDVISVIVVRHPFSWNMRIEVYHRYNRCSFHLRRPCNRYERHSLSECLLKSVHAGRRVGLVPARREPTLKPRQERSRTRPRDVALL